MSPTRRALADAHVHLHDCFDIGRFLNAAVRNFRRNRVALGLPVGVRDVLFLTESVRVEGFERLARGGLARWRIAHEREEVLVATREENGDAVAVVSGRQVATREGLEVLALGTRQRFEDGTPFGEALERVRGSDAVAVVPWGFGKWWLGRGRIVREMIDSAPPGEVHLGDNGGRLAGARVPRAFHRARSRGLLVLPGSDPLPFPGEALRPGSYGFLLDTAPGDGETDWAGGLRALRGQPQSFGERTTLWPFVKSQLAMQFAKRKGRS